MTQYNTVQLNSPDKYLFSSVLAHENKNCEIVAIFHEEPGTLENKEDTRKQKDTQRLWISRHNIVKIATLSKATYRVSATPIQTPTQLFTEIEKKNSSISYGNTKYQIVKNNPEFKKSMEINVVAPQKALNPADTFLSTY